MWKSEGWKWTRVSIFRFLDVGLTSSGESSLPWEGVWTACFWWSWWNLPPSVPVLCTSLPHWVTPGHLTKAGQDCSWHNASESVIGICALASIPLEVSQNPEDDCEDASTAIQQGPWREWGPPLNPCWPREGEVLEVPAVLKLWSSQHEAEHPAPSQPLILWEINCFNPLNAM
jgi:hypothetical protein